MTNYLEYLYRRNNQGKPCYWYIEKTGISSYTIHHGVVGGTDIPEHVIVKKDVAKEIDTKIANKRKSGYKYLSELKDNTCAPVEGELLHYLTAYLPNIRTTDDGRVLAMLAKKFDNENNKMFKKVSEYLGQWKINGLRCFVSAYKSDDMFAETHLQFQSREGIIWKTLKHLEEYLLSVLPEELINKMLDENYILDGEVYLPGYSVNDINSFVKNPRTNGNKLLQFWCYDLAIQDTTQHTRINLLNRFLLPYNKNFYTKDQHLSNTQKLIVLPCEWITDGNIVTNARDKYINNGFEGLILRDPSQEYQFGKRNSALIKYKKSTDGKFKIIDIYSEGEKRPDIPLFLLRNDINSATFEVHVGGTFDYQKSVLRNAQQYIGRYMYVEYGERSGVDNVPFHVKTTYIL